MLSDTMMMGGGRKAAYSMESSLLFKGSQYLSRTPNAGGNRKTWTFSCFVRRAKFGAAQTIFSVSDGGSGEGYLGFDDSDHLWFVNDGMLMVSSWVNTVAVFRDPGFYHLVWVADATNSVEADRMRLYVNNVRQSFVQTPIINDAEGWINNPSWAHAIGRHQRGATAYFDGYIAEPQFVDGAALAPEHFGELDSVTGSWRPKKSAVVGYGTNGFHLGKPWNGASLGTDYSGKGNHWAPASGFLPANVVSDNPTNVFCIMNPLDKSGGTVSEGGLKTVNNNNQYIRGTHAVSSGRFYFEVKPVSGVSWGGMGLLPASAAVNQWSLSKSYAWTGNNGQAVAYGASWANNDVIGVLYDNGTVTFYKNGTSQGVAYTGVTGPVMPWQDTGTTGIFEWNFGQRPFLHPVADALPWCTANIPATSGQTSGTFTGNANADGPCVYTGAVPQTLTINGNAVVWGTHADKLATGFKIRTANASHNATGSNTWSATYNKKPTIGTNKVAANAQINP